MKSSKSTYVVTNGRGLYFVKWDDINAIIAIDNQPGILSTAKHFKDFSEAEKVAEILGLIDPKKHQKTLDILYGIVYNIIRKIKKGSYKVAQKVN